MVEEEQAHHNGGEESDDEGEEEKEVGLEPLVPMQGNPTPEIQ